MHQTIDILKIAVLNTYISTGGAARAAMRLNAGLRQAGLDLTTLSRATYPQTVTGDSKKRNWLSWFLGCMHLLPCKFYPKRQLHNFSSNWMPDGLGRRLRRLSPDLIHLHWVGDGFFRIENLARCNTPIVWTLHDSWAFTGGCHLPGKCHRYREQCGYCSVLGSARENDLSRRVWSRKHIAWKDIHLTAVAPSRWLADCARSSSLLRERRVEVIPNGIDVKTYLPGDSAAARSALGLPLDGRLILFGAVHSLSDSNKGLDLLLAAVSNLDNSLQKKAELVVFGDRSDLDVQGCGLPVRNLGIIAEESRLALLYQAADLFVAPSRQENLPNMVLEAMACGTPCVAFDVGGLPDLINHGINGYLARPFEAKDLCRGISWVLADEIRRLTMANLSREKIVAGFSLKHVVDRYLDLYRELASRKDGQLLPESVNQSV